jgi:hypothetical protein
MKDNKRFIVPAAALLGVIVLAPVVVPLFVPWSRINCRTVDINIRTGEARRARHLWCVRMSWAIEETAISKALGGVTVGKEDGDPWRRVLTLSMWQGHSPHYTFHSALYQAGQLDQLSVLYRLSDAEKREIATKILTLWQVDGSDSAAGQYLAKLDSDDEIERLRNRVRGQGKP